MREILEKYVGSPLTMDAIQRIRYELEQNGYNIPYICASSNEEAFSLDEDHITHFVCENGMWEKAGTYLH